MLIFEDSLKCMGCFGVVLILLLMSFSSLVVSDEAVFSQVDEEIRRNIEFFCYSDSVDSMNGKSQLMLQQFQESLMSSGDTLVHSEESTVKNQEVWSLNSYNVDNLVNGSLFDPKDTPWPMKCHDNWHTGLSPYSTADNNGAELWRFKCSWVEGGPVIDSDGTIYFGDTWGTLYALYPDGELSWKFEEFNGRITSSPVIGEDGMIYVGSWDHFFYALNPDGTLKWRVELGRTITSSPAIGDDGTIYTGTMGNKIYAIYPNGTVKWEYKTGSDIIGDPAIGDDGTIYIGSWDTYLYAMNTDGTLKWRFKTDNHIKGPPSIADDGTIYIGSYDDYLYALHPDGSLKWQCKTGYGAETNPSIGPDGTIYVGGEKLYAINPDGTVKWTFDLGEDQDIFQSSPAISADGIIYVGTNIGEVDGGDIIAVNPDGTLRWRHRISNSGWVDSSPCIDANGIVYIGSSEANSTDFFGHLYAFGPGEENNPPESPTIQGTTNGKTGETYTYRISGTDPDNDDVFLFVDWGDSSDSGWQGPYSSGSSIELSHSWSERASFTVKAKTKDEHDLESAWTSLEVTMPKNRFFQFSLMEWLQNHFRFFSFNR
jgi:outer membrane protein assembly factor BamB